LKPRAVRACWARGPGLQRRRQALAARKAPRAETSQPDASGREGDIRILLNIAVQINGRADRDDDSNANAADDAVLGFLPGD
jgi:hypothetical protein